MGEKEQRTLDVVLYRIQQARGASEDWHKNIVRWRRRYDFDHYDVKAKKGEQRFADPTYTNTVDLAVGIFQSNNMIWRSKAWAPGKKENVGTDQVEKYLASVLSINDDRNQYSIEYEANLNFIRDGGCVLYSVWDVGLAKQLKKTAKMIDDDGNEKTVSVYQASPVLTQVVDPLNVFVLPGGPKRWVAVMQQTSMSIYDVESIYGVKLERYAAYPMNQKLDTHGVLIDYWDYDYEDSADLKPEPGQISTGPDTVTPADRVLVVRHGVIFEDIVVEGIHPMVGYEDIPYTIGLYKPTKKDDSSGWSSILQPLETTVKSLEDAINRRQHQIDVFTALPLTVRTAAGRVVKLDPGLGTVQQLNTDERIEFPQWPGNPPDVQEQEAFFRSRIQQSGFSDVMYGSGASQISGYAISQLGDQNRIRLEPPLDQLQKAWSWWAQKVIQITATFAKNTQIIAYGISRKMQFAETILGGDLEGFDIHCEIQAVFPNEEVRQHAMATQVKGLVSEHRILEDYLKIQQPEEEIQRRLLEQATQNPIAQQYALISALQTLANQGDKIAQMTLQSIQQNGIPGQAGRPNEPNAPEQPLGLQGPTGQPTPQAQGGPPPGQDMNGSMQAMTEAAPGMNGQVGGYG